MRQRLLFPLALLAIILLISASFGLFAGWVTGRSVANATSKRFADTTSVINQVQSLAQLVSVKYVIEKVIVSEDAKWFGDNRLILVAHGVAKAGFDLKALQLHDLEIIGEKLQIRLPRPSITDVYLEERKTSVIERSTGVLRMFEKDLETEARRHAVDRIRAAAMEAGILKDAEERVRTQLNTLALQLGFSEVEIRIKN